MSTFKLSQEIVALLTAKNKTLCTAESITGGGIGAAITSAHGASACYVGGFVAYTNKMKSELLNVADSSLFNEGPVSESVVRTMAQNAREQTSASFALASSGIAGPDGGTKEHPVGTVWIALASQGNHAHAQKFNFVGEREEVRQQAVVAALTMLRDALQSL